MGNHLFCYGVHQLKKAYGGFTIILEIKNTGVDCLISNHAHNVQRLLNKRVESLLHQTANIVVDILTGFSKVFAELLNTESQQRRSTARRGIHYLSSFLKLSDYVIWKVSVWLNRSLVAREEKAIMHPDRALFAVVALG